MYALRTNAVKKKIGKGPEWSLYERLLAGLPTEETVRRCLVGSAWTLVEASGVGMAMSFHDDTWQDCPTSRIASRSPMWRAI